MDSNEVARNLPDSSDCDEGGPNAPIFPDQPGEIGNLPVIDHKRERRVFRSVFEGSDRRSAVNRRRHCISYAGSDRRAHRHPLRRSHQILPLIALSGDLLTLLIVLMIPALALGMFVAEATPNRNYMASASWQFALVGTLFLVTNWLRGTYSKKVSMSDDLSELLYMVSIAIGTQSILAGLIGSREVLLGLLVTWCLAFVVISITRLIVKKALHRAGLWTRPTVIIGSGENASKTAHALQSDWLLGCNVIEFINYATEAPQHTTRVTEINRGKATEVVDVMGHHIPVRHIDSMNKDVFEALGNPHIVVAIDSLDYRQIVRLLYEADVAYSSLTIVPSLRGVPMNGLGMAHVFSHDVLILTVQNNLVRFIPRALKRGFDVLAASTLLFLLSPLMLLTAGAVSTSGRNVIFGHERIGQRGKKFECYKFRSMVNNSAAVLEEVLKNDPEARAEWNRSFKLRNDPRVTRFGHFIRKTSIDELPQLINVLKGEMSLVGPRPVISEELERYEDRQDLYNMVKPGITGLWQISGRSDVSYEERVNLDSWYSKNWSLWYDFVILCKTLNVVFQRVGAY